MRDFLLSLIWWRHPAMLRTVIANLVDSEVAIRGVLWRARGPWLILRDCSALAPGGEASKVDGEVVIERRRIQFLQVW